MPVIYMRDTSGHVFTTTHAEYHPDAVKLKKAEGEAAILAQKKEGLLKMIGPGSTVYSVCHSVSRSGMSRELSFYVSHEGRIVGINHYIAAIKGYKLGNHGLKIGGCGMDMGFHVVYGLGRALWPNGTPEAHGTRNGAPDKDGGYALKHEWL